MSKNTIQNLRAPLAPYRGASYSVAMPRKTTVKHAQKLHRSPLTFGGRMRSEREQRGISSSVVAERCGVRVRTVQRWETGEIQILLLHAVAVAKAIGVPVADLIGTENSRG